MVASHPQPSACQAGPAFPVEQAGRYHGSTPPWPHPLKPIGFHGMKQEDRARPGTSWKSYSCADAEEGGSMRRGVEAARRGLVLRPSIWGQARVLAAPLVLLAA